MEQNRQAPVTLSVALGGSVGTCPSTGPRQQELQEQARRVWRKPTKEHLDLSLGGLERRGVPDNTSETGPAPFLTD